MRFGWLARTAFLFLALSSQLSAISRQENPKTVKVSTSSLMFRFLFAYTLPQKCPAPPGAECESPARKCRASVGREKLYESRRDGTGFVLRGMKILSCNRCLQSPIRKK